MKAIISYYRGPGNVRGSRYWATDGDGLRVSVQASDTLTSDQNHEAAVRKLCKVYGWTGSLVRGGLMRAGHQVGYVWVWRQERLKVAEEIAIQ